MLHFKPTTPRNNWALLRYLACALFVVFFCGCATSRKAHAPLVPGNVHADVSFAPGFRRVALLPTNWKGAQTGPQQKSVELIELALLEELQKTQRFEVRRITRQELMDWLGRPEFSAEESLPNELFSLLKEELDCDGVLFSKLSSLRAYPPLALGWNLKLVNLRDSRVLWAVDELYDASESQIAAAARSYQNGRQPSLGPLQDPLIILKSPRLFAHFTASTLLVTLPDHFSETKVFQSSADKESGRKNEKNLPAKEGR